MKLRRCEQCRTYTFKPDCPKCGNKTVNPRPPKYSPQDKFGDLRRRFKFNFSED